MASTPTTSPAATFSRIREVWRGDIAAVGTDYWPGDELGSWSDMDRRYLVEDLRKGWTTLVEQARTNGLGVYDDVARLKVRTSQVELIVALQPDDERRKVS